MDYIYVIEAPTYPKFVLTLDRPLAANEQVQITAGRYAGLVLVVNNIRHKADESLGMDEQGVHMTSLCSIAYASIVKRENGT